MVTACQPTPDPAPQWVVTVTTDAPIPQLGDRLVIELTDANGELCAGCRRILDVGQPGDWPVSFGIVPEGPVTRRFRLRARLFRVALAIDEGVPDGEALIDAAGWLPGPSEVTLELRADCFGVVDDDLATTCDPSSASLQPLPILSPGTTAALAPGSWPPAQPVPCSNAPDGMVCVPGGVFLLGEPRPVPPLSNGAEAGPERLVRISPFALDRDEITVADALEHLAYLPGVVAETAPGRAPRFGCTNDPDGVGDDLPLNCLDRAQAAALCERLGKRLPSEAEWEYAAARRQQEVTYPWGEQDDVCERAIVARGSFFDGQDASCLGMDLGLEAGLAEGGDPDDVTELGLRNLAGNVSEWVADDFASFSDADCWPSGQLLSDPRCDEGSGLGVARGGSWILGRTSARSATRLVVGEHEQLDGVGVRCAVSR